MPIDASVGLISVWDVAVAQESMLELACVRLEKVYCQVLPFVCIISINKLSIILC